MYRITLTKSGAAFDCAPDAMILDAAEDAGWSLAHSCRSGTCRACITRVLSGVVEHDPEYAAYLSIDAGEVAAGYRLLCNSFARGDVELEK
ncbi:MAG: 2Fe-2S iron-sulfur cluster-binding protein [Chloroflexota bacterium]|nr:2Fe-2S iron-sulfur cluster-binding protein [Chloroflexota bacterium]